MNHLRPDEQASRAEIERHKSKNQMIKKGLSLVGSAAAGAVGAGVSSRIVPFLSEYVPVDLALKGISKVSPKMGDFLKRGMEKGLNLKDGMEYLKSRLQPDEEQAEAKEERNIIEQYSPELHQFMDQEIKSGRRPIEAGALAQNDKRFDKIIKKLSEDHKTPWSNILESVYGASDMAQAHQQPHQGQTQQGQQPGGGQEALMAILQKLQQARGGQ